MTAHSKSLVVSWFVSRIKFASMVLEYEETSRCFRSSFDSQEQIRPPEMVILSPRGENTRRVRRDGFLPIGRPPLAPFSALPSLAWFISKFTESFTCCYARGIVGRVYFRKTPKMHDITIRNAKRCNIAIFLPFTDRKSFC